MEKVEIIEDLIGKTFRSVFEGTIKISSYHDKSESLIFESAKNKFAFYHEQDCCEGVYIESISGDLNDLTESPIIQAEYTTKHEENQDECESKTWTFYKFATIKGRVTVRWVGESNGYYSEEVDFKEIEGKDILGVKNE
jgi:hypothetical protein